MLVLWGWGEPAWGHPGLGCWEAAALSSGCVLLLTRV